MESSWDQIRTVFAHALLPLIAYAIGDFAILTMTMKNSLMNLSADYVRTAVAKGCRFARR
jgi:microcin C transport system permease protein